jgi:DNA polymerase-3 subunit beta
MKIVADTRQLLATLSAASRIGAKEVLIEAGDNPALQAGGHGIQAMWTLEGIDVDSSGETVAPLSSLLPLLKSCGDEKVVMDVKGTQLRVRGARFEHIFATTAADAFPRISDESPKESSIVSGHSLFDSLKKVAPACDECDGRFAFGSVLFQSDKKELAIVSTDGNRLSRCFIEMDREAKADCLVPRKLSQSVQQVIQGCDRVGLGFTSSRLRVAAGNCVMLVALTEGRFPRWRDSVAVPAKHKFDLPAGFMRGAISQAVIALTSLDEERRIEVSASSGTLRLECNGESGRGLVEIPIPDCQFKASFRYQYLLDAMAGFRDEDNLEFGFTAGIDARITDGNGFLAFIRPLIFG